MSIDRQDNVRLMADRCQLIKQKHEEAAVWGAGWGLYSCTQYRNSSQRGSRWALHTYMYAQNYLPRASDTCWLPSIGSQTLVVGIKRAWKTTGTDLISFSFLFFKHLGCTACIFSCRLAGGEKKKWCFFLI